MKLSPAQVRRVTENFDGRVVPEGHAASPELETIFGRHTFFLDSDGLTIIEQSAADSEKGNVVKLATWTDAKRTKLEPHEPEPTSIVVEIGAPSTDGADQI